LKQLTSDNVETILGVASLLKYFLDETCEMEKSDFFSKVCQKYFDRWNIGIEKIIKIISFEEFKTMSSDLLEILLLDAGGYNKDDFKLYSQFGLKPYFPIYESTDNFEKVLESISFKQLKELSLDQTFIILERSDYLKDVLTKISFQELKSFSDKELFKMFSMSNDLKAKRKELASYLCKKLNKKRFLNKEFDESILLKITTHKLFYFLMDLEGSYKILKYVNFNQINDFSFDLFYNIRLCDEAFIRLFRYANCDQILSFSDDQLISLLDEDCNYSKVFSLLSIDQIKQLNSEQILILFEESYYLDRILNKISFNQLKQLNKSQLACLLINTSYLDYVFEEFSFDELKLLSNEKMTEVLRKN
jgi:hypothetical protein